MGRRPAAFTQADVSRALRAVESCGREAVVEITREGTIRIVPLEIAGKTEEQEIDGREPVNL